MLAGLGNHNTIDQGARNKYLTWVQRSGSSDTLHLNYDDPSRVLNGHCHREIVQNEGLPLGRNIPVRIGSCASQKGYVDRKSSVKQPLATIDRDELNQILCGSAVDFSTIASRVYKGAYPHF